jgi:hypothetical protein
VSADWTTLGELLPWLRGQAVHLAAAGAEPELTRTLRAAGFTLARAVVAEPPAGGERYQPVVVALRLPDSAAGNLDALADSLRDLPLRWPGCDRLALLVAGADSLVRGDLLSWLQLSLVLGQATATLWQSNGLILETVFLFPDGTFGVDAPH